MLLLIIHNLPSTICHSDVKSLLESKCGLSDLVLDNLLSEGRNKCVTVGVSDEAEAAILVRKINGLYMDSQHQLYVQVVRKKRDPNSIAYQNQAYIPVMQTMSKAPLMQEQLNTNNTNQNWGHQQQSVSWDGDSQYLQPQPNSRSNNRDNDRVVETNPPEQPWSQDQCNSAPNEPPMFGLDMSRPERLSRPEPNGNGINRGSAHNHRRKKDRSWEPPAKKSRLSNPPHFDKPAPEGLPSLSLEKKVRRDDTWKGQAAAEICRSLVQNVQKKKPFVPDSDILKALKQAIRARIDVIFGGKIGVQSKEIVVKYRDKYGPSTDIKLFNLVMVRLRTEKKVAIDKDLVKEQKNLAEKEFADEMDFQLEALDTEMNAIEDILRAEATDPKDNSDIKVCKDINDKAAEELKKKICRLTEILQLMCRNTKSATQSQSESALPLVDPVDRDNADIDELNVFYNNEPSDKRVKNNFPKDFFRLDKLLRVLYTRIKYTPERKYQTDVSDFTESVDKVYFSAYQDDHLITPSQKTLLLQNISVVQKRLRVLYQTDNLRPGCENQLDNKNNFCSDVTETNENIGINICQEYPGTGDTEEEPRKNKSMNSFHNTKQNIIIDQTSLDVARNKHIEQMSTNRLQNKVSVKTLSAQELLTQVVEQSLVAQTPNENMETIISSGQSNIENIQTFKVYQKGYEQIRTPMLPNEEVEQIPIFELQNRDIKQTQKTEGIEQIQTCEIQNKDIGQKRTSDLSHADNENIPIVESKNTDTEQSSSKNERSNTVIKLIPISRLQRKVDDLPNNNIKHIPTPKQNETIHNSRDFESHVISVVSEIANNLKQDFAIRLLGSVRSVIAHELHNEVNRKMLIAALQNKNVGHRSRLHGYSSRLHELLVRKIVMENKIQTFNKLLSTKAKKVLKSYDLSFVNEIIRIKVENFRNYFYEHLLQSVKRAVARELENYTQGNQTIGAADVLLPEKPIYTNDVNSISNFIGVNSSKHNNNLKKYQVCVCQGAVATNIAYNILKKIGHISTGKQKRKVLKDITIAVLARLDDLTLTNEIEITEISTLEKFYVENYPPDQDKELIDLGMIKHNLNLNHEEVTIEASEHVAMQTYTIPAVFSASQSENLRQCSVGSINNIGECNLNDVQQNNERNVPAPNENENGNHVFNVTTNNNTKTEVKVIVKRGKTTNITKESAIESNETITNSSPIEPKVIITERSDFKPKDSVIERSATKSYETVIYSSAIETNITSTERSPRTFTAEEALVGEPENSNEEYQAAKTANMKLVNKENVDNVQLSINHKLKKYEVLFCRMEVAIKIAKLIWKKIKCVLERDQIKMVDIEIAVLARLDDLTLTNEIDATTFSKLLNIYVENYPPDQDALVIKHNLKLSHDGTTQCSFGSIDNICEIKFDNNVQQNNEKNIIAPDNMNLKLQHNEVATEARELEGMQTYNTAAVPVSQSKNLQQWSVGSTDNICEINYDINTNNNVQQNNECNITAANNFVTKSQDGQNNENLSHVYELATNNNVITEEVIDGIVQREETTNFIEESALDSIKTITYCSAIEPNVTITEKWHGSVEGALVREPRLTYEEHQTSETADIEIANQENMDDDNLSTHHKLKRYEVLFCQTEAANYIASTILKKIIPGKIRIKGRFKKVQRYTIIAVFARLDDLALTNKIEATTVSELTNLYVGNYPMDQDKELTDLVMIKHNLNHNEARTEVSEPEVMQNYNTAAVLPVFQSENLQQCSVGSIDNILEINVNSQTVEPNESIIEECAIGSKETITYGSDIDKENPITEKGLRPVLGDEAIVGELSDIETNVSITENSLRPVLDKLAIVEKLRNINEEYQAAKTANIELVNQENVNNVHSSKNHKLEKYEVLFSQIEVAKFIANTILEKFKRKRRGPVQRVRMDIGIAVLARLDDLILTDKIKSIAVSSLKKLYVKKYPPAQDIELIHLAMSKYNLKLKHNKVATETREVVPMKTCNTAVLPVSQNENLQECSVSFIDNICESNYDINTNNNVQQNKESNIIAANNFVTKSQDGQNHENSNHVFEVALKNNIKTEGIDDIIKREETANTVDNNANFNNMKWKVNTEDNKEEIKIDGCDMGTSSRKKSVPAPNIEIKKAPKKTFGRKPYHSWPYQSFYRPRYYNMNHWSYRVRNMKWKINEATDVQAQIQQLKEEIASGISDTKVVEGVTIKQEIKEEHED